MRTYAKSTPARLVLTTLTGLFLVALNIIWSDPNVGSVLVGLPPGQNLPFWLDVTAVGNASPVTVSVGIRSTDLDVGTYNVTLRVVTRDLTANPISSIDVPVTYTVSDPFIVSPTQLTFDHVLDNAQAPSDQSIDIRGAGVNWNATVDQPWVTLSAASGGTPATDVRKSVSSSLNRRRCHHTSTLS